MLHDVQLSALVIQVRELLKRKRFDQALELLDICRASPNNAAWVDAATAQAGLLLLLDAAFERAVEVLCRVPLATFQPCELFVLFPQYTRWVTGVCHRATCCCWVPLHPCWLMHVNSVSARSSSLRLLELQDSPSPCSTSRAGAVRHWHATSSNTIPCHTQRPLASACI